MPISSREQFPQYRLHNILTLKAKIEKDLDLQGLFYAPLVEDVFYELTNRLRQLIGRVEPDIMEDSCRYLLGEQLTPDELARLAWRLAANRNRLMNCQSVRPWTGQYGHEWVPAQITAWRLRRSRRGRIGAVFTYRVLAGLPAGMTTEQFWTTEYCRVFAAQMGFSRWANEKYPFSDIRQMADLRLYIRTLPGTPDLAFDQVGFPEYELILGWNRRIIKRRSRLEFECPRKYPSTQDCHTCPAGRDQCPAAVHPHSYALKDCEGCGFRAWFADGPICVNCAERAVLQGEA